MNDTNGPHTSSPSVKKDVSDGYDELNDEEHLSEKKHVATT